LTPLGRNTGFKLIAEKIYLLCSNQQFPLGVYEAEDVAGSRMKEKKRGEKEGRRRRGD
jgi:hypothetical protein